ncbi:MAG: hypothetical protein JNM62_15320 [Flavobacteriales bacterium]|nr:hypothetical protein [Flavobacteriales bacterium]
MKKVLALVLLLFAILVSCTKENLQESLVVFEDQGDRLELDPQQFPFNALSSYHFFKGHMALQKPVLGVLPYAPINALFSDYAHKFRFVWMPAGTHATYNGDNEVLDFPDGTVLIKTFYYDRVQPADVRRLVETRLLFKRNGAWEFANYVWNAQQTEATLDLNGSYTPITWVEEGGATRTVNYRIPSQAECFTCHKFDGVSTPIGPKPQNLNSLFSYGDKTGFANTANKNQLAHWVQQGYLQPGFPKRIATVPRWEDVALPLTDRVRGYVDINCAHCHREGSHCDYRPMRFAYSETADPENLGVCVPPDDPLLPQHTFIVARGNTARSLLHYRVAATDEAERMPLLGRTLVHDEGLALITEWINSLSPACP